MEEMVMNDSFYHGKRVFVTGHTGFKGSWMCYVLYKMGAIVTGYALNPPTNPSLYEILNIEDKVHSVIGDIRNINELSDAIKEAKPDIVIHMAAQPLVIDSYKNPRYTYETNVMGTVNVLEAVRSCSSVRSFLNVTTDKVYKNKEWIWGYRENDELNGYDPYSNSKSCSELVTDCYTKCFFNEAEVAISRARAGNVIGGGDFSENRIIPDCVKAAMNNEDIIVRNPNSVRPYQHVLEPVFAYLMIAQEQYQNKDSAGEFNVGPNESDCVTTKELVTTFCEAWGNGLAWTSTIKDGPHEANFLKLDCSKIKNQFGWKPVWDVKEAVNKTVEFSKIYQEHGDTESCVDMQIEEFWRKMPL